MPFSLRLRQDPVFEENEAEPEEKEASESGSEPDAAAEADSELELDADSDAPGAVGPVSGLRLDFEQRGTSGTNAERDAKQPAKLEWIGRFTKSVRDQPEPEEMTLGELSGELELTGSPPGAVFTCDAASLQKLTEEPEEDEDEDEDEDDKPPYFVPHSLELEFGDTIEGLEALDGKPARLQLPKEAGSFRYLEVCVRLTVAGGSESDFDENDILDVLLRPAPRPSYPFSL